MRTFLFTIGVLLITAGLAASNASHANVPGQWQDVFYLSPGCDNQVLAMAERDDGKVYIGGNFLFCDGVKVNRIALFDPVENTFEPLIHDGVIGVNANVLALAWADGDLFVGGHLSMAGPREVNQVARWDGSAWHRLGSALSNGVAWSGTGNAVVEALVWVAGDLYVAGLFDSAGTSPANSVARWSGGQWHLLGTTANNGVQASFSPSGRARALQPLGSGVFVAGNFDSAGGTPANGLALWNGASWTSVGEGPSHGPGFDLGTFTYINTLLLDGSNLYVGGRVDFVDAMGNECERCVMRWDGSSWLGLPFDSEFANRSQNQVLDLAVHQGNLYAGVRYRDALNIERDGFRRWTGSQWQILGSPSTVVRGSSLLATSNQDLLVGGDIGLVNGQPQHGLLRWSGTQFQAAGLPGGQGSAALVGAIVEHNGQLHIPKGRRVARWDGTQWHYLPGTFNDGVSALASFQGQLYAGGFFTELDNEPALRIVRFDGAEWFPVGGGIPAVDGSSVSFPGVRTLVEDNGLLYVAGEFDQAGNVPANSIASWNGTSWSALSSLLGNGLERVVGQNIRPASASGLMNHAGSIYVVGDFDLAGGAAASRIARWDGSGWFAVGGGLNGFPRALSWHAGELHVGGSGLADQQGNTLGPLARLSGGQWQAASGFAGTGQVNALASLDGWLYVGGSNLPWVDGDALGRWNGLQWQRFDSGILYGQVSTVRVDQQGVAIGGTFRQAGPYASSYFGMFDFELGDAIFSDRFQAVLP
ncbi:MAG: hypothetical protein JJU31_09585 [Wenzhouxiangella sp.]|nr:hypothetical protein [Wenzhouxiangella sp.]